MIPTIDIGLIAGLSAIGSFLAACWRFLNSGLDFLLRKSLGVMVASRFWATAAFMAVGVLCFTLFGQLISAAVTFVGRYAIGSYDYPDWVLTGWGFCNRCFDVSPVLGLPGFIVGVLTAYYSVIWSSFLFRRLVGLMRIISSNWKT